MDPNSLFDDDFSEDHLFSGLNDDSSSQSEPAERFISFQEVLEVQQEHERRVQARKEREQQIESPNPNPEVQESIEEDSTSTKAQPDSFVEPVEQTKKSQAGPHSSSRLTSRFHSRPFGVKVVVALIVFLIGAGAVFLFSPYTRIQAMVCTGNYYYTPQQVFAIAGLNINNRLFLYPEGAVEKKLMENPLIEKASVVRDGQKLNVSIEEKTIIGYYEKDGANYLVSSSGERIPVENETELRTLIHFPLMADLSEENIDKIAKECADHPDLLTRATFEKIAEILPWEESYDRNMLKLVLQDGNTVFTSIGSLHMMAAYPKILENLQGENVCLVLDGDNNVVNKVACDYMYLPPEQRAENREIPKDVLDFLPKEEQTSSESAAPEQSTDPNAQPQPEQTEPQPEEPQQPEQNESNDTISDWEASAVDGVLYSPSTGLFYWPDGGVYYTYDEATDTFTPVSRQ